MIDSIKAHENDSDVYANITWIAFFFFSFIDEINMSSFIRSCAIHIRVFHINFLDFLDSLIENHTEILKTHSILKLSIRNTQPIYPSEEHI